MTPGAPHEAGTVGLGAARRLIGAREKEADFQGAVLELAGYNGWLCHHVYDSRRCTPGFPDIVAVRGEQVLFAELKQEGRYPTPAQREWLDRLSGASVVSARLWRPSSWPEIEGALGRSA